MLIWHKAVTSLSNRYTRLHTRMASVTTGRKRKVIIDTDAGVDDAQALMIALTQHKLGNLEIIGISTVTGNVKLQRVIQNVARVQHTLGTSIPIYKGARFPLLGRSGVNASYWHGTDGLGDSNFPDLGTESSLCFPGTSEDSMNTAECASHSAAVNLSKLVRKYPNEVSIVALGPLTNIALALSLDPELSGLVQEFWWMGGSRSSGNITKFAEFNAYGDPEALAVCLSNFRRIQCVDWQATLDHGISFKFVEALFEKSSHTTNGRFMSAISKKLIAQSKSSEYSRNGFLIPDPLCMIAFCFRGCVKEYIDSKVVCNINDVEQRGRTICTDAVASSLNSDWPSTEEGEACNVRFFTRLDMKCIEEAFLSVCSL